jgi:hypothetical protein
MVHVSNVSSGGGDTHISSVKFILLNMNYEQGHVQICFSLQSVLITDVTLEPGKFYRSAQRRIIEDSNVHSELLPFHPEDGGEICV